MRKQINRDEILREQARLLRINGVSYRKIADLTGLTVSVIRTLSKGINDQESPVSPSFTESDNEVCGYCGGPMEQPSGAGRPRRFCCDHCRRQYWRLHRVEQKRNPQIIYTRICRYCGEPFEIYGKNDRKYCCREHYLKHFWGEGAAPQMKSETVQPAV